MNFPKLVLRWSLVVQSEINAGQYPFPVEYPLAVMQVESGGMVGNVNPISGASGLMQVMPGTLAEYNKHNSPKIPLSTLQSKLPMHASAQIRVGLWVMGQYLRTGYRWISETDPNPGISDLIRISDLMYVAGPNKIKRKFRNVHPRTYESMRAAFPDWQPFDHPDKVWRFTAVENSPQWNFQAISQWVQSSTSPPTQTTNPPVQNGFAMGVLIIALASAFLFPKK